jgi:hypothetical protein
MGILMYVLGGVVALGLGVYLGLPGRFEQSVDEIDQRLDQDGEHAKVNRKETVLTVLQKRSERASDRRRAASSRKPFRLRD